VRSGNGAAGHSQPGTCGDLFDTLTRSVSVGQVLDQATGRMLADLADHCCDVWTHENSGLWELSGRARPALAAGGRRHHPWVQAHYWSQAKQSYTFYAGTDDLDAAILLAGRTGFDRGQRLASTIGAVTAELGRGSFLYRYGMDREENAFVAVGLVGRHRKGEALRAHLA